MAIERGAQKGGFTLIGGGKAYVAGTGGAGTLDTIDINAGTFTTGRPSRARHFRT